MTKHILSSMAAMMILFATSIAQAGLVAVVSAKNPVSALSKDQMEDIYLGNSKNFPGGGTAVPLDLPENAPERLEFEKAVTGKSPAQFKAHWAKMVFSGRGSPPKEVSSATEIKSLVAGNPNMIGYIEQSAVDATVKVVFQAN